MNTLTFNIVHAIIPKRSIMPPLMILPVSMYNNYLWYAYSKNYVSVTIIYGMLILKLCKRDNLFCYILYVVYNGIFCTNHEK